MENLASKAKQGFTASVVRQRDAKFLWLIFLTRALGSGALLEMKGLGDALNENLLTLVQAAREEQARASPEGKMN